MIRVDRGSRVHKGELIVRLSAPELVAQRAQAESALRAAESQLTTAQAKLTSDKGTYLHIASAAKTPGVVAENDVMVASQTASADQGQVQSAENNVAAARNALRSVAQLESYLNIYAPFDGVVTTRNLHPGALVGPASGPSGTMPIVQIVDTDHLRLVVPVPEAYVGEMQVGQQVAFTVPAHPGETFHAPIARISHDVELNTRTMPVELDIHSLAAACRPAVSALCNGRSTVLVQPCLCLSPRSRTTNNELSSSEYATGSRMGGCGHWSECERQYRSFRRPEAWR